MSSTSFTIKAAIATSLPLTGEGDEVILDRNGEVIARFYNGNFITTYLPNTLGQDTVVTKEAA